MITRSRELDLLRGLVRTAPVVAILGPRQVGKTTLARQFSARYRGPTRWFDLEDPDDLARLAEPKLALSEHQGLIVIDEVQRRPELFPMLRVLADRPGTKTRFLLLGSASPDLLRQSSESLAGRIHYHELRGFSVSEVGNAAAERLWGRGGFPRSFLARTDVLSLTWRSDFIRTFLERDLANFGFRVPAPTLLRFWRMLGHYHGQLWNAAELARAFGVAASTVRHYLDILTAALVVRQLEPWYENIGKRQVKSPKVYVRDSGLLHALLAIADREALLDHPKVGASWEGFVLEDLLSRLAPGAGEAFFWRTHTGAELDLLIVRGRRRIGFEIKRTTAPAMTRSLYSAQETLRLDQLVLVHAGSETFKLPGGAHAMAFDRLDADLKSLG